MTVTSGHFDLPELTNNDARQVLEAMGQKATDEAIRNLRNMMANTNALSKSVKSSYMIETHLEIKTNDPMSGRLPLKTHCRNHPRTSLSGEFY
jgi:hypothetical protein